MRLLTALILAVAAHLSAAAQTSPEFKCRETQATLKRTGNLEPNLDWGTDCLDKANQPPANNILSVVCNEFTTDELSAASSKFEMEGKQYLWSYSAVENKPLPSGVPTTTTRSWIVRIDPEAQSFTATTKLQFVGGKHSLTELAESAGPCRPETKNR